MQKKPGQISSNTLSLRFMQNAVRAREEREREAAGVRVRREEEWEVGEEVRRAWAVVAGGGEGGTVSYEPSYLPFLFAPAVTPDVKGEPGGVAHTYKGRRKFGKHGHEEAEDPPAPPPVPAPPSVDTLPRGARSISSHGRTAPSRPPKSTPAPREFMKPPIDAPRSPSTSHKRRHADPDPDPDTDAPPPSTAGRAGRPKKKPRDAARE